MRKASRMLGTIVGISLVLSMALAAVGLTKELTPGEFLDLSTPDKLKAKDITVRAWGGYLYWRDAPLLDQLDKEEATIKGWEWLHTGNTELLGAAHSIALFELANPNVKVEFIDWPEAMTHEAHTSSLLTMIAEGAAPAFFNQGAGMTSDTWVKEGYAADVTEYFHQYFDPMLSPVRMDIANEFQSRSGFMREDKIYALPGNFYFPLNGYRCRKDWFQEAGIFNKDGEPGYDFDWTIEDYRNIMKKLTDPKKKRWGSVSMSEKAPGLLFRQMTWPLVDGPKLGGNEALYVPDQSGEFGFVFPSDSPALIETLKFFNELIFKDKTMLAVTGEIYNEWNAGRIGMILEHPMAPWALATFTSTAKLDGKPIKDITFFGPPPKGLTGLQYAQAHLGSQMFDPTLSKEELDAAVKLYMWNQFGVGRDLRQMDMKIRYDIVGPRALDQTLLGPTALWSKDIPGMPPEEFLPEQIKKFSAYWDTIAARAMGVGPVDFGLKRDLTKDENILCDSLLSKAMTDPNFDAEKELAWTAEKLNALRTAEAFSVEDQKEKLKAYVSYIDKFWREVWPEHYNSKLYKEEWDKYYAWVLE